MSTYAPDVPAELEAILARGLAANRDERYASARELGSAIGRALLAKQEFVDASTLEAAIAQLVARDPARAEEVAPAPQNRTQAAVPLARAGGDPASPASALPPRPDGAPLDAAAREGGAAVGPREVRHVAVVTIRLHGLAELRAKDAQAAQRTVDRITTALGDIAYKRNARIAAGGDDDEIRAVTGVTSNPTRAAADAAWLALDTHEVITGIGEGLPIPIAASVGIVRGIASGMRDAHGNLVRHRLHDPALYLAEVVGKATPVRSTWVGGGVYRLVRKDFRWGDAPTLTVEPRPDVDSVPGAMRMYSLERSLSREERVASAAIAPSDLVGRDAERADLSSAYHEAAGGEGRVIYRAVVGELGIGKTALAGAFLGELPPNARLVRAECSPVRMEVPLSTIAELVRDAIGTTGEEPFEQVAELIARAGGGAAHGDATSPLVARLAELATNRLGAGGDDEDASVRKRLIASGVRSLFAAVALQQPLVVLVDSLQWADKASLDLMGELMRRDDPLPILIVYVTRLEDRVGPLLEGIVRIELMGLSAEEQVRLVENRLGVRAGVREVCADLMPRVAGNPFFLLEMIDALLERGSLEIRELGEGDDRRSALVQAKREGLSGLPSTLEQLLEDRLRELPAREHDLVDWLAIAGGPLAVSDLQTLAGGLSIQDEVTRLCARGVCDDRAGALDFRHPLARDVAYRALLPLDRAHMHRALGELLAQSSLARGLSAAIVARHFARGEDGARAATYYVEAGNAARIANQNPLAIRYLKRADSLLGARAPERFAVHESLETLYRMLGRRRERVHHLDALRAAAKHAPTQRNACLALLRTARFHFDEGHLSRGMPVARKAAEVAHASNVPALEIEAEALVSEFLRELGDVPGALAACDRALAASNPNVNPSIPARTRAEVLRSRGVLLRRVGRVREAISAQVDAIAMFRAAGARRQEARAKNSLAFALFVQGHYEDAIALLIEAIQIDLSVGGRFQLANTLTNIGHAYAKIGDLPRAQAYLARARDTHERYGDQDNRADTLVVSAEVMIEEGRLEEAESLLRDAAALNQATDNAYSATHEGVVRALLARARRDAKGAIGHALEARRSAEDQSLVSFHFYGLALEAAARVDAGEMHTATLLATTALGVVETLQGCEYGLDIRVLCADALKRAGSPQAPLARQRAIDYASSLLSGIRDPRNKELFSRRPVVAALFDTTPVPTALPSARSLLERGPSSAP